MANAFDKFDAPSGNAFDKFDGAILPPPDWQAMHDADPTSDMSTYQKATAGMGKGMTDLARGVGQMAGVVSNKDVAISRELDAPLMKTKSGKFGNFVGQVAATAPAMLIPGVNTYAGAALFGAGTGAAQPVVDGESRLLNTGMGAVGGVAGQKLGNVIGNQISKKVASNALSKAQNATKDAATKEIIDAGYTVPRSLYNPKFISNRVEGLAGKAAVKQQSAFNSQQTTNSLARKYLGLADDVPLSPSLIDDLKLVQNKAYTDAAALPKAIVGQTTRKSLSTGQQISQPIIKSGDDLVKEINRVRDDIRSAWQSAKSPMSPNRNASRNEAEMLEKTLDTLESQLDKLAKHHGATDIINNLNKSRTNLAKINTIDNAMNEATGDVSAKMLETMANKGKKLTGEAETIVKFAKRFPQIAQDGVKVPAPGVSKSEWLSSALLGTVGFGASGGVGTVAAALPFLSHAARPYALSKTMQSLPKYGGNALNIANKTSPLLPYIGTGFGGLLGANAN